MTTKANMRLVFDNEQAGDDHFDLYEDADGLLYETSNAMTLELVCSYMFMSWGHDYLAGEKWLDALTEQFGGDRAVAERYQRAALDMDK